MVDYIVLGGGVSGLNTARELGKLGFEVQIFEADNRWGGLAGYVRKFGRNLDLGPHIFHTPDKDVEDYLTTEFTDKFYERKHWAKNYKNNRYFDYPISREFINSLGPALASRIQIELENAQKADKTDSKTYFDYMTALAGPTLREMFFTVYPEKLWGVSTKELDANWAPKRVEIREERSPFFGTQWSAVGINGTSSIIDELVEQCSSLGVKMHLAEPVNRIITDSDLFVKKIITKKASYDVGRQTRVINSLPLDISNSLFGHTADIEYRGVTLVYVHTSNTKPFPEGTDFLYFDDPEIVFNRVSDQNTFVENPSVLDTVLCCEITYSAGDKTDQSESQVIFDDVTSGLIKAGLLKHEEILGLDLIKLPRVYPMFRVGYREKATVALSNIAKYKNFHTIGSLAEFSYTDVQVLFAKSRDLASTLAGKTHRINGTGLNKKQIILKSEFELLGRQIGTSNPCFLIAEIGLNHNGNIEMAKTLINKAVEAGFDAVKFQTFKSEGRSSQSGKTSRYVEKILGTEETDYQMFSKTELSYDDHRELFAYARSKGISVFSAPFDVASVDLLEELNIDAYKIASMELTNIELIEYVASKGKPMIISTGMATLSDIEDAVRVISHVGNSELAILQCTSIYPAPENTINLMVIKTLQRAFSVPIGLSDHYHNDIMSIASIPLGASVIEKHVTLDRRLEGPDHALSLEPEEQLRFVNSIRAVEAALGDGVKQPSTEELKSEMRFKKSLYFANDLPEGHMLTSDDLILKAPCFGILPKYKDIVIGMTLKTKVEKDDPVSWDVV